MLEQRCFASNKTSLELLQELRDRENEIEQWKEDLRTEQECHRIDVESLKEEFRNKTENLKAEFRATITRTISEMTTQHNEKLVAIKSRIAIYIPVKNDETDTKLADYINRYPDKSKLKIMFMRESEGVY